MSARPPRRPPPEVQWTPEQIDKIASETPCFELGPELDRLVSLLPDKAARCDRTTVLTWAYKLNGLISFNQIWQRTTGYRDERAARKAVTGVLRVLESQSLVTLVHFGADAPKKNADGVNEGTGVELTTRGMIWLGHAWTARKQVARNIGLLDAHAQLCEEEEEGKAPLHYVTPVVINAAAAKATARPAPSFVFDLGAPASTSRGR